jgi:hypothetical protein
MSQAGEIDVVSNNPDIPTNFVTDDGNAVPIGNTLEILGTSVPAGTTPVETTGSGNTVTIEVQTSQAIAASNASNIGLAAFDSTAFSVDANGFVTLNGGGGAITTFDVQAVTAPGTDPVVPSGGGVVTVNGAAVANHSVVLETRSRAANAFNLEVQYSAAAAATDATKSGVSHFNSTEFTVDANGFVSLAGGSLAIDSIGTQTGTNPIVPTAGGLVTINGAVVAAGTNPVRSDGTGANTMAIEVQISQALAATDATKIGLSNFDSAAFDVDANGFVQLNGGGIASTSFDVQANTAPGTDPVVPTSAGLVTVNGAAVANHSVVLETRSRAANAYNLEVQYATSAAATDATKSGVAHFDSSQFTVDANGFVSVSNIPGVITTTYNVADSPATWTKNANTKFVTVYVWGGGGGGGSGRKGVSGSAGGGGGGGGSSAAIFSGPASAFNNTESVIIGAGGAGGASQAADANNGNVGSSGNTSSFGTITAIGGANGGGGTTTTGAAGSPRTLSSQFANTNIGNTGGTGSQLDGSAGANESVFIGSTGGGGGGGADIVTQRAGGAAGAILNTAGGTILAGASGGLESTGINGATGNPAPTSGGVFGGGSGGGGGGGYSVGAGGATTGGTGGTGAVRGGGGGGGGGGISAVANSGAGGQGGDGQVIVVEFL